MAIKEKDFVAVEYTARFTDGVLFDTTSEKEAKESEIFNKDLTYGAVVVCIGEGHILPKLEQFLIGKEMGTTYTIELEPENAFGKKDSQLLRLVPTTAFRKQNIVPYPGLTVNIDGVLGVVKTVSGGRSIVDFNHPFSGRAVRYSITPIRAVIEPKEKIEALLQHLLLMKNNQINLSEDKAEIILKLKLPESIAAHVAEKVKELTGISAEFKAQ